MKTLKERTEIQVASLAGHVIQYKHFNDAEWMNCDNLPLFNWWKKDYRIKNTPSKLFINFYADGSLYAHETEDSAKLAIHDISDFKRTAKYIEVIK